MQDNRLLIDAYQSQLGLVMARFNAVVKKLEYADEVEAVSLEPQRDDLYKQSQEIQAQIDKLEREQQDSALSELVELLNPSYELLHSKIEVAYHKALNQRTIGTHFQGATNLINGLLSRVVPDGAYPWVHRLVEYLLLPEPDLQPESQLSPGLVAALNQWANAHIENRVDLQALIQQEQNDRQMKQPCLLIRIRHSNQASANSQEERYYVNAWFIEDVQAYRNKRTNQAKPVHWPVNPQQAKASDGQGTSGVATPAKTYAAGEIEAIIRQLRQACVQQFGVPRPMVQVFLPLKLMNINVDYWPIQEGNMRKRFGTEHEVILRASDRLNPSQFELWQDLQAKWDMLESKFTQVAFNVFEDAYDADSVYSRGRLREVLGISLGQALSALEEGDLADLFEVLVLDSDIPLALWVRKSHDGIDCCGELSKILKACCVEKLAKSVMEKRLEIFQVRRELRESHIGNHLSLLWDDPKLLPPDLPNAV